MLKITTIVLALCIVFLGCATTQGPPVARIPFPIEEYEKLPQTGTSGITGNMPLIINSSDPRYAAIRAVNLRPVTSYSKQWYEISIIQKKDMKPDDEKNFDKRWYWATMPMMSDIEGRFVFKNLPAGEYFLQLTYLCVNPSCIKDTYTPKIIDSVVKRITLKEGETQEIILTK